MSDSASLSEPVVFGALVGLVAILIWLIWFSYTKDIRDDIRKWREEEKERHKELIETLKKK